MAETGSEPGDVRRRRIRDPERTRRVIVEAVLAALDEGDLFPSAREVAERAGISPRSVFVHFADLDELRVAAALHRGEQIDALVVDVDPHAPLADRIDALVTQGERMYPLQTGVRSAEVAHARTAPLLVELARARRRQFEDQYARAFAPELESSPEQTLSAVVGVLDWSFRHQLVGRQGLDPDQSSAVIIRTLTALLA